MRASSETGRQGRLGALLDALRGAFRRPRVVTMTAGHGRGLRFCYGPSNEQYGVGDNEPPVQDALAGLLKPGAVFFDIGANVGFFTVIAARLVGEQGRVYAFEPVPANAALVRRNVRLNGFTNVTVLEQAVSDRSGRDRLILAAYSGGAALAAADRPPDAVSETTVKTVTVDDAVTSGLAIPPTVIKIDVEGAEKQVLEGASEVLRRHRPIVLFEIDGETDSAVRAKADACCKLVEAAGYDVGRLESAYPDTRWIVEHYLATPSM